MVLLIQAKNTSHLLRLLSYSKTSTNLLTRITYTGPYQCSPLKKPGTFTSSELSLWLLHPDIQTCLGAPNAAAPTWMHHT